MQTISYGGLVESSSSRVQYQAVKSSACGIPSRQFTSHQRSMDLKALKNLQGMISKILFLKGPGPPATMVVPVPLKSWDFALAEQLEQLVPTRLYFQNDLKTPSPSSVLSSLNILTTVQNPSSSNGDLTNIASIQVMNNQLVPNDAHGIHPSELQWIHKGQCLTASDLLHDGQLLLTDSSSRRYPDHHLNILTLKSLGEEVISVANGRGSSLVLDVGVAASEAFYEEEDESRGFRTADRVSVVRVPSTKKQGSWEIMVEKESIFNTKEDGMDSFKYAAALNEWDTWSRHHSALYGCKHLVQMHGFHKRRNSIHLFSELCRGGDLQTLLKKKHGRLDEEMVHSIACDILSGLETLHNTGLIYGDLKPANVFIGGSEIDPHYKIGDYGTMREKGRKHLHYFVSGFGFTPEYASPETLDYGTSKAGMQSDIWSFGVLLHELATGSLPGVAVEFKRLHEEGLESGAASRQRKKYLQTHPPSGILYETRASERPISQSLKRVIASCLSINTKDRPRSVSELRSRQAWFNIGSAADQSIEEEFAENDLTEWLTPEDGFVRYWGMDDVAV